MNKIEPAVRMAAGGPVILSFLISFLSMGASPAATVNVTRGPYLQLGTPDSVIVRWRTDVATESHVRFGTSLGSLDTAVSESAFTTEHSVLIDGLQTSTKYFYEFGTSSTGWFPGDPEDFFITPPPHGTAVNTRIWAIGDSGTANADAAAVRNAYVNFTGATRTDVWLMLGDNAYDTGTDQQFQTAMFDMYPTLLRNTVVWSTRGNHEQGGSGTTPYYDIFTLPTGGEAGGLASGTEAYYSFDFGNVHFICLDSYGSDRSSGGAMARWLGLDLASTLQDWIIAYWHHPPYTKGSHDSDLEDDLIKMRENFLPILEAGGVDLVLTGHSHSYERSYLVDAHYDFSGTFNSSMVVNGGSGREDGSGAYLKPTYGPASHEGAVYIVAGSSGKIAGGSLNHPAMYVSLNNLGSMVLDVFGNRLDVKFLRENGVVADYFTMIKGGISVPSAPQNLAAVPGDGEANLTWDQSLGADTYNVYRSATAGGPYGSPVASGITETSHLDPGLINGIPSYYVVTAVNEVGESANSTEVSATPSAQVDDAAHGELTISGTVVSGSFLDTQASDNVYEEVRERESGGKPNNRHSVLEHKWTVDVTGGSTVTFFVEAHHSLVTGEEEDFVFAWSADDVNYSDMLVVTKTTDDNSYQSFALPDTVSGTVFIRVKDTDQTPTKKYLDTLFVDDLFVRSDNSISSGVPSVPTGLMASPGNRQVTLSWTPSSGADSYIVYRSTSSGGETFLSGGITETSYVDTGLNNGTPYFYVVSAVNNNGESAASDEAGATPQVPSLPEPPTNLSVSQKGKGKLTLNWNQSSSAGVTQNNVYRSNSSAGPFDLLVTLSATTSYQDASASSGAAHWYRVTALSSGGESVPSNQDSGVAR